MYTIDRTGPRWPVHAFIMIIVCSIRDTESDQAVALFSMKDYKVGMGRVDDALY